MKISAHIHQAGQTAHPYGNFSASRTKSPPLQDLLVKMRTLSCKTPRKKTTLLRGPAPDSRISMGTQREVFRRINLHYGDAVTIHVSKFLGRSCCMGDIVNRSMRGVARIIIAAWAKIIEPCP